MTGLLLTAAMVVASPGTDTPPAKTIVQWRRDVQEALILQAKATNPAQRERTIRNLARLHDEVRRDQHLPLRERWKLRIKMASRLRRVQDELKREVSSSTSRAASQPSVNHKGQRGGGAVGPDDRGDELIDLIHTTISPESWDVNGGPGVARMARIGAGARGGGIAAGHHGEELIDLIQATIAPETWEPAGGAGAIRLWRQ